MNDRINIVSYVRTNRSYVVDFVRQHGKPDAVRALREMFDADGLRVDGVADVFFVPSPALRNGHYGPSETLFIIDALLHDD